MQPQIIQSHDPGFHNTNPKTTVRLIEGGSWKKQRVVVLIPAPATMSTKVALSHWGLAFPPNQPVHRMLCTGMEVGHAYSSAIESILTHQDLKDWEYLLTIEYDNIPPGDGLVKLIKQMEVHPEYSCIGGLYFCKGPEGCAHIWGDISDPVVNYRPQVPRQNELVECYGTSMGFNLWRLSIFKDARLQKPWFKTIDGSDGKGIGTQDLSAWNDFRKYGYRCAVDCSILVGHHDLEGKYGPQDFVW